MVRIFTLVLAGLWLHAARAAEIARGHASIGGVDRTYALYVPQTAAAGGAPLLVLLHGSGGSGLRIAQLWKDMAERNGIVLLAPDAFRNDRWRLREDSPEVIHAIIDAACAPVPVDGRRIYLFGQSGGAVYALLLGMLEAPYFAAVAVHAGSWRNAQDYNAIKFARRKIPVAIIIGSEDEFFSVASVRRTEDALRTAGFPVQTTILPGQHHAFFEGNAAEIEDDAWRFLSGHALDGPPAFVSYR